MSLRPREAFSLHCDRCEVFFIGVDGATSSVWPEEFVAEAKQLGWISHTFMNHLCDQCHFSGNAIPLPGPHGYEGSCLPGARCRADYCHLPYRHPLHV